MTRFGALILVAMAGLLGAAEDGGQAEAWTKLGLGARSSAVGKAVSAFSGDLGAAQVNPALLATLQEFSFGSQLAYLPDGRQLHYLALGRPVYQAAAWSLGLSYAQFGFDQPLERRRGNSATPDSEFKESASSISLQLAGWPSRKRLALGGALKILNHSLGDAGGGGVSLDLGAFGHATDWLDWGLGLRDGLSRLGWNTGQTEEMPRQWRLGLAGHVPSQPWGAYAEVWLRDGQAPGWAHGAELWLFQRHLGLRAGLEDGAWRLGFGLSRRFKAWTGRLDYCLGSDPVTDAAFQHRISLDVDLPL